jgi:hypothetical protein
MRHRAPGSSAFDTAGVQFWGNFDSPKIGPAGARMPYRETIGQVPLFFDLYQCSC